MPLFRVHGHAGIVADVLMGAGGDVEQRGLPAVGIAHQGDPDDMAAFFSEVFQGRVQPLPLLHVLRKSLQVFIRLQGLPGLLFGRHFDLTGLFPPEREFVADDFVFDGVPERSIQDDPHFLSLDKAHLYQAFPETSMPMDTDNHGLFACLQFG